MQLPILSSVLLLAASTRAQLFGSGSTANATPQTRNLNITTDVQFLPAGGSSDPALEQLSGKPRLVNGVRTDVNVRVVNFEEKPIVVEYIGASLVDPRRDNIIIKNFTSLKVGASLGYDLQLDQPYSFAADLPEQELSLQVALVLTTPQGEIVTVQAYNGTVSIVEPESSIFDPQMLFLYVLLATLFGGAGYMVYNTWVASVSPKPRRKFDTPRPAPAASPAQASTASGYEESWIPEHHLKRPQTKARGASKGKKATAE